ncbi:MAG: prephenate dehydrogenase [Gammaproteobacteria bacterium 28-57-27]|nr:MAG: prephenate dehydrogenase [Gammaproteobacteria bacterium 28-57-27]
MSFFSRRVCVIGSGLIGGSLALALKQVGAVADVMGCGRNSATLQRALELGIVDHYSTDIAEAVQGADMVVLSVPMLAMRDVLAQIEPVMQPGMIVTDVGSAKQSVIDDARAVLGDKLGQFVPAHPIAGTEKSGPDAAFAELFAQRRVIVTPLAENSEADVARVVAMWECVGAMVECMSAEHHDHVLAATSHLPHLLAFTLVDSLARMDESREVFRYAAGGFRDFTRIAASDPTMWRDIALANSFEISLILQQYQQELEDLQRDLQTRNAQALFARFSRAQTAREGIKL